MTMFGGVLISEYSTLSFVVIIFNLGFLIASSFIILPFYFQKVKIKWNELKSKRRGTSRLLLNEQIDEEEILIF
jgi:uncharacterized membrane protein YciS (DUF1049 family)